MKNYLTKSIYRAKIRNTLLLKRFELQLNLFFTLSASFFPKIYSHFTHSIVKLTNLFLTMRKIACVLKGVSGVELFCPFTLSRRPEHTPSHYFFSFPNVKITCDMS